MFDQLPHLIWLGLIATTLDVDNALYMTSATQGRSEDEQKRLIFWGLCAEYVARFALLLIAFFLASGKEVFFTVAGIDVTPQVIALLGAGTFLFLSSVGDLNDVLAGKSDDACGQKSTGKATFTELLVQMTIVNAVLSIDTVIAVADMTDKLAGAAIILAVSAGIRFLFVRQIAGFIARHPETKIVILTFLTLIGLQLVLQAVHDDLPQSAFNLIMVVAIVVALMRRH
ncbi:MAG: TerC family protein, partial [Hyphomicrobiaceae bacterium]